MVTGRLHMFKSEAHVLINPRATYFYIAYFATRAGMILVPLNCYLEIFTPTRKYLRPT